jgi:hypothetical protein
LEVKTRDIGTGDDSIFATLHHMKRLAKRDANSEVVNNIAKKIKAKCKNNEECLAEETFNYVFNNITYKFDKDLVGDYIEVKGDIEHYEFFSAPKYLFGKVFEGDCDDMATGMASIYTNLKMPNLMVIIAWKNSSFSHVYNEVLITGKDGKQYWIPSDAVIKEFGKEKRPLLRKYVLRVDTDDDEIIKVIG